MSYFVGIVGSGDAHTKAAYAHGVHNDYKPKEIAAALLFCT
jgi:hypothetical protein